MKRPRDLAAGVGRTLCLGAGLLAAAGIVVGAAAAKSSPHATFDAARLLPGRFVYRIARRGEEIARFTLTIRRQSDGNYEFTGEATGFDQRWQSVATPSFDPLRAALETGKAGSRYEMHLTYADGFATGAEIRSAPDPGREGADVAPARESAIRAPVPAGTVDQRIDWAAMLSCSLAAGETLAFFVYDPKTRVSRVEGSGAGDGRVVVPAGAFDTVAFDYRIRKKTGVEAYRVHATRSLPRMMVREDFPNGELTELVSFTTAEDSPKGP